MNDARKRLIIALDDLELKQVLELISLTREFSAIFKVGLGLFTAYGPSIINEIKSLGSEVFLDLKLHDIPMQVARAVEGALKHEPLFLTLHASGGSSMLCAAAQAAKGSQTQLLAVSVLTSLDQQQWQQIGFSDPISVSTIKLLDLAFKANINGFVLSPHEIRAVKKIYGPSCVTVCPGIRPSDSQVGDQARFMTPAQALKAGADFLVVGRPISMSPQPKLSAERICQEMTEVAKR